MEFSFSKGLNSLRKEATIGTRSFLLRVDSCLDAFVHPARKKTDSIKNYHPFKRCKHTCFFLSFLQRETNFLFVSL